MISFNQDKTLSQGGSVLLWTWVAFTTFYTLLSFAYPFIQSEKVNSARQSGYVQGVNETTQQALQTFSGNVFQNGYSTAVNQLVDELAKQYEAGCEKEVPVTIGTGSIGVVSVPCLQKINTPSATGTTSSTGTVQR